MGCVAVISAPFSRRPRVASWAAVVRARRGHDHLPAYGDIFAAIGVGGIHNHAAEAFDDIVVAEQAFPRDGDGPRG